METVYLETSLVSYLVSRPSRDLIVAGHQQLTREWWERRRAKFACFISNVVLDEAREGDAEQAALRLKALEGIPRLPFPRPSDGRGIKGEGTGDSPPTIPAFAAAAPGAILVPMPTLEINTTRPRLISQAGSVAEIIGKFGGAGQLRNAMLYRQTTLRNHLHRTRGLLLPRVLSGQGNLTTN